MKKLNKFEMAAVKRTALITKKLRKKAEKISAEIVALGAELSEINEQIGKWEAPVKEMANGYDSVQVIALDGEIPDDLNEGIAAEYPASDTEAMNAPAPQASDEPF